MQPLRSLINFSCLSLFAAVSFAGSAAAQSVAARDIAIILPAAGTVRIPAVAPYFASKWLDRVEEAFAATAVGNAVAEESARPDWRLVAVRFAPCQPLLPFLTPQNLILCVPELRLVWQPIEPRHNGQYFADDRAIHALYDLDPALFLPADAAAEFARLRAGAARLGPADAAAYGRLHRRLVAAFVQELVALRGDTDGRLYDGIDERPEFLSRPVATAFVANLQTLLRRHALPGLLHEMTAFSLPAGREPSTTDEWVFVAFAPSAGGRDVVGKRITLQSKADGSALFDYGMSARGTMRRDDDSLYDALAGMPGSRAAVVTSSVLMLANEPEAKKRDIADGRRTHIAHTSCASCHKLNDLLFDFHNLSYLMDHPLTVSPRVTADVAHELEWLKQR